MFVLVVVLVVIKYIKYLLRATSNFSKISNLFFYRLSLYVLHMH